MFLWHSSGKYGSLSAVFWSLSIKTAVSQAKSIKTVKHFDYFCGANWLQNTPVTDNNF